MKCVQQATTEVKQDGSRESSEGKPRYDLVPIWFYEFLDNRLGVSRYTGYDGYFGLAKLFEADYIKTQYNIDELEDCFCSVFTDIYSSCCSDTSNTVVLSDSRAWSIYHKVSEALGRNSYKYGDWNWARGIPNREHMASFCRHCAKMTAGMTDEDHYGHALTNLFFMLYNLHMFQEVGLNCKIACDGVDVSDKWNYENMIKIQAPIFTKIDVSN